MNTFNRLAAPVGFIAFVLSSLLITESVQAEITYVDDYSEIMIRASVFDEFSETSTHNLATQTVKPKRPPAFPYEDTQSLIMMTYRTGSPSIDHKVLTTPGFIRGEIDCIDADTCFNLVDVHVKIGDAKPIKTQGLVRDDHEGFSLWPNLEKTNANGEAFYPVTEALLASTEKQVTIMVRVPFGTSGNITLSYDFDVEAYKRFHAEYETARAEYKAKR